MPKKRYSSEQIIVKLREAEVLESKGKGQLVGGTWPFKICEKINASPVLKGVKFVDLYVGANYQFSFVIIALISGLLAVSVCL